MTNIDIWSKAEHVWAVGANELESLGGKIEKDRFTQIIKLIAECTGRVVVAGVGTSGAAAKKIAHSLSCVECPSFFLDPADAVHGALGCVQPGDVAILISKGGGTSEILNLIPSLKEKGVTIIGITENEKSVLGLNSDIYLKIKIEKEADNFNMLATTSTMAVTAVFDAVCIVLMEYTGFTREQFLVIHPGGAVGERLLKGNKK